MGRVEGKPVRIVLMRGLSLWATGAEDTSEFVALRDNDAEVSFSDTCFLLTEGRSWEH